jgi:cobalamin biosynthesis Mg chelatase CobN
MANTAARRALPSDPAPSPMPSAGSSVAPRSRAPSAAALTAETDAPVVPVTRGPMIVIFAALAVVLLGLGVWLGASLGQ